MNKLHCVYVQSLCQHAVRMRLEWICYFTLEWCGSNVLRPEWCCRSVCVCVCVCMIIAVGHSQPEEHTYRSGC